MNDITKREPLWHDRDSLEELQASPLFRALHEHLDYKCDYRNVRELATLSFFSEDARHLDKVKYSKNDEGTFREMKNIVVALDEELQKTTAPTPFPDL